MKKPVRATKEQIEKLMTKRKRGTYRVTKNVPSGDWPGVVTTAHEFAGKNNVKVSDVKFKNSYYGSCYMEIKTPETDEQFFKRLKENEDRKYRDKKYEYDRWSREQARIKAQEDQMLANRLLVEAKANRRNSNVQCCPSNCCCRRS